MLDKDTVYYSAAKHGGKAHGDDATGLADIEFPNIVQGSAWAAAWMPVTDVGLREPVADLTSPVVIQIKL
jgi:hypothetical protein